MQKYSQVKIKSNFKNVEIFVIASKSFLGNWDFFKPYYEN